MLELKKEQEEMGNMLLQTIISICISDIGGIRMLPPRNLSKLYSIIYKEFSNTAIISFTDKNEVTVEVFIGVEYDLSIPEKCKKLQLLIKQEIEVITGYTVKAVNVNVDEILKK
jgi:uncharacterized alkaline shock family protein YloU